MPPGAVACRGLIAAREVPQFQLLALRQQRSVHAGGAACANGQLVHVEVEHVAALVMQALQRLLHVEQEAVKFSSRRMSRLMMNSCCDSVVSRPGSRCRSQRVARGIAALGHPLAGKAAEIVAVVKPIFPIGSRPRDDARAMEMGGIGLRRETIRPALAEPPFVLPIAEPRCASRFWPKPSVL